MFSTPKHSSSIKKFSNGIVLTESVYASDQRLTEHSHEESTFCMSLRGSCSETYRQQVREYPPFAFEFLPSGEEHSMVASKAGLHSLNVKLSSRWLERANEYSLKINEYLYAKGGNISYLMMKLYGEFQNTDEASPLAVEGIVFEMIAEVSRFHVKAAAASRPPRWIEQARDFLQAHFRENPSLMIVAQSVNIHPTHLSREFSRYYGCTMGEYVKRLRIEYASRELSATVTPLTHIALSAGFSDQSHFSRVFKRATGKSPAEFRTSYGKS